MSKPKYQFSNMQAFLKHISLKLASSKVVIVGESDHIPANFKAEMIKFLPEFKSRGFSHFGSEMFASSQNDLLRKFSNNPHNSADSQVMAHLTKSWQHGGMVTSKSYFDMFNAARSANMTIVGLDLDHETRHKLGNQIYFNGPMCNNKNYVPPSTKEQCLYSEHQLRNAHMANEIEKVVKQGHKMVAYMHWGHSASVNRSKYGKDAVEQGVKYYLVSRGIPTLVIKLVGAPKLFVVESYNGKETYNVDGKDTTTQDGYKTEMFARQHKIRDKWFYIEKPTSESQEDYILHLPEIGVQRGVHKDVSPN